MSSSGNSTTFRTATEKRYIRRDATNNPLVESVSGSSSQSSRPRLPQHLSQETLNEYFHGNIERGDFSNFHNDARLNSIQYQNAKNKTKFRHSLDNSSFKHVKSYSQRGRTEHMKNLYPEQHLSSQSMQISTEITPDSECSVKSDNYMQNSSRNFYGNTQLNVNRNSEMRNSHADSKGKHIFNDSSSQISSDIPSPEIRRKLLKKPPETNSNNSEIILSQDSKPVSIYESASIISDSSSVRYSNARKAMVEKIFRIAQQKDHIQNQVQHSFSSYSQTADRSNAEHVESGPTQESAVTFARTAPKVIFHINFLNNSYIHIFANIGRIFI